MGRAKFGILLFCIVSLFYGLVPAAATDFAEYPIKGWLTLPSKKTEFPVDISGAMLDWHQTQMKLLNESYEFVKEQSPGSQRNVATLCIEIAFEGKTEIFGIENTIFVSGTDITLMDELDEQSNANDSLGQCKFLCVGRSSKIPVNELRKEFVGFFGFEEVLAPEKKAYMSKLFQMGFQTSPKREVLDAYEASLYGHFFQESSDEEAAKLGLRNYQNPNKQTLDDIFAEVQLNFTDSEQAIRLYIRDGDLLLDSQVIAKTISVENLGLDGKKVAAWGQLIENLKKLKSDSSLTNVILRNVRKMELTNTLIPPEDGDSYLQGEKEFVVSANQYIDQRKSFIHQLEQNKKSLQQTIRDTQVEVDKFQMNDFEKKFSIKLHISSYYGMCLNCQGTFFHELTTKKQLQASILYKLFSDIGDKDLRNTLHYALGSSESTEFNASTVLIFSYLKDYH